MAQLIQSGREAKSSPGALQIEFATPFSRIPNITVSSEWVDSHGSVAYIETITKTSPFSFTVTSENAAGNYFVQWIAVGEE